MKNRIVVVDDDELTLELIARRLRNTSVQLTCFNDGGEAIKYLHNHGSDVLLIDHCMPQQTGLELLQELELEADLKSTRVFLCSAATLPYEISAKAKSLGVATMSKELYRDKAALLQLLQ